MTYIVNPQNVVAILLPDGKWYDVISETFKVNEDLPTPWFSCRWRRPGSTSHATGVPLSGPLTSVLAIQQRRRTDP